MKSFFSFIGEFISRNPLTVVLFIVLLVAAPQVLGIFALILLVPLLLALIGGAIFLWKIHRVQKNMEEQVRNAKSQGGYTRQQQGARSAREGRVTVTTTEAPHKRVSEDVGEYVDFKEVKE